MRAKTLKNINTISHMELRLLSLTGRESNTRYTIHNGTSDWSYIYECHFE